jgi:hypothetical protein
MVSSLLCDALTDPTAVLVDIFQNSSDLDQFPSNVATHFQHVFSTEDALKEVAYLLLSARIGNPDIQNRFRPSMFIIHHIFTMTDPWCGLML